MHFLPLTCWLCAALGCLDQGAAHEQVRKTCTDSGLFSQVLGALNAEELCDLKPLCLPGGRISPFFLGIKRSYGSCFLCILSQEKNKLMWGLTLSLLHVNLELDISIFSMQKVPWHQNSWVTCWRLHRSSVVQTFTKRQSFESVVFLLLEAWGSVQIIKLWLEWIKGWVHRELPPILCPTPRSSVRLWALQQRAHHIMPTLEVHPRLNRDHVHFPGSTCPAHATASFLQSVKVLF